MGRLHNKHPTGLAIITGSGVAGACIRLHKYTVSRPFRPALPLPEGLCLYCFWDSNLSFIHNLSKFPVKIPSSPAFSPNFSGLN